MSTAGVRRISGNRNPLKTVKNAFYLTLKPLFVFKILKCLSSFFFGLVGRLFDKEAKVRFKIYDII